MEKNLMRLVSEYQESNKEVALITVIYVAGIDNCSLGKMMVSDSQGNVLAGNIENGLLEKKAAELGRICIKRGLSRKETIYVDEGVIEIFINAFCNQDNLLIAGAGTVSLNIHKIARMLGYRTTVLDNRAEMLTEDRFPEAHELLSGNIIENLRTYPIAENTYIVIATHNHEFDEEALRTVIDSQANYIGVLGNSRRVAEYFRNLEPFNLPDELIKRVHSPIGLDLGGKKTAEIALSIMAEIQAVKYKRTMVFNK
ncbi:XdhC family protein [Parasporobacterium paucivorans]|uniref:Xanthine dehydrogenase accessory factor n=1 Tax=Parasporobacterium paucivorans DSM 15970 TaxID=1122934 RepID=A0A1M6ELA8_9FIRM|nr:XdhC family protein [Parasporobacterium paucivorans]SHI86186.1 xanthine dehydrogenase accessory factor [Parasporobacterium paucivorans DSM 15970]